MLKGTRTVQIDRIFSIEFRLLPVAPQMPISKHGRWETSKSYSTESYPIYFISIDLIFREKITSICGDVCAGVRSERQIERACSLVRLLESKSYGEP